MPTETNYGPTLPSVTPRHIPWLVVSGRNWRSATESLMHPEQAGLSWLRGRRPANEQQLTLSIRCTRMDLLDAAERVRGYLRACGFKVPPVELVSGGTAMIEVVA